MTRTGKRPNNICTQAEKLVCNQGAGISPAALFLSRGSTRQCRKTFNHPVRVQLPPPCPKSDKRGIYRGQSLKLIQFQPILPQKKPQKWLIETQTIFQRGNARGRRQSLIAFQKFKKMIDRNADNKKIERHADFYCRQRWQAFFWIFGDFDNSGVGGRSPAPNYNQCLQLLQSLTTTHRILTTTGGK